MTLLISKMIIILTLFILRIRLIRRFHAASSEQVHTGEIPAKDLLTCAIVGIIYFIFTTLAESTRSRGVTEVVRAETTDVGHDIQYTELYNLVSRFLSTLFVLLCLIFHNGDDDEVHSVAIVVIIICCLMIFWNILYRKLFNFNPSSIPWIIALHFGSILIVTSGCILCYLTSSLVTMIKLKIMTTLCHGYYHQS